MSTLHTPNTPSAASWGAAPVSVVILTLNEEINIADCLASCAWCDDVAVLDSGSTDRTADIARGMGATVYVNRFESFGKQRNWAIDHIPARHNWVFHLDADERFTPELVAALRDLLGADPPQAGFHVPNKFMFMDTWLKRTMQYPAYQMRLFHKARMRFTDYGHGQREDTAGEVGTFDVPYLHYAMSKGLGDWFERHNRYSTAEAAKAFDVLHRGGGSLAQILSSRGIERRRAIKEFAYRLPCRATLRYLHTLFIAGAVLEGRAGRTYAALLHTYERMITLKLRVLRAEAGARGASTTLPGA